jgi:ribosomal-protein-alanine N-acetyltransferase
MPPPFALEALVGGAASEPLPDEDRRQVEALSAAALHGNVVYIATELAKPWARAWIARAEDRSPVGFLVAWHVADELHVLGVAVAEAHRRRGMGVALMGAAQDYARGCAIRLLLLEVRRSNRPAIRLYRRLGWSAMGVRPGYYADGEDAVEMMMTLDPATGEVIPSPDEVRLEP